MSPPYKIEYGIAPKRFFNKENQNPSNKQKDSPPEAIIIASRAKKAKSPRKQFEIISIGECYYIGPVDSEVGAQPELAEHVITGTGSLYDKNGRLLYEGQFYKGQFHGKGIRYYPDGSRYEGNFKEGKYQGEGVLYSKNEEIIYEGDFQDNCYHGRGVLYKSGKREYEGEFKNGQPEGEGTKYYNNGSLYIGNFIEGRENGSGKIYLPGIEEPFQVDAKPISSEESKFKIVGKLNSASSYYELEFLNGDFGKKIVFTYPLKNKLEFELESIKSIADIKIPMQNEGVFCRANGEQYRVKFNQNQLVLYDKENGEKIYEGEFKDGQPHGQGIRYYSNGSRYEGSFINGQENGSGKIYLPDIKEPFQVRSIRPISPKENKFKITGRFIPEKLNLDINEEVLYTLYELEFENGVLGNEVILTDYPSESKLEFNCNSIKSEQNIKIPTQGEGRFYTFDKDYLVKFNKNKVDLYDDNKEQLFYSGKIRGAKLTSGKIRVWKNDKEYDEYEGDIDQSAWNQELIKIERRPVKYFVSPQKGKFVCKNGSYISLETRQQKAIKYQLRPLSNKFLAGYIYIEGIGRLEGVFKSELLDLISDNRGRDIEKIKRTFIRGNIFDGATRKFISQKSTVWEFCYTDYQEEFEVLKKAVDTIKKEFSENTEQRESILQNLIMQESASSDDFFSKIGIAEDLRRKITVLPELYKSLLEEEKQPGYLNKQLLLEKYPKLFSANDIIIRLKDNTRFNKQGLVSIYKSQINIFNAFAAEVSIFEPKADFSKLESYQELNSVCTRIIDKLFHYQGKNKNRIESVSQVINEIANIYSKLLQQGSLKNLSNIKILTELEKFIAEQRDLVWENHCQNQNFFTRSLRTKSSLFKIYQEILAELKELNLTQQPMNQHLKKQNKVEVKENSTARDSLVTLRLFLRC